MSHGNSFSLVDRRALEKTRISLQRAPQAAYLQEEDKEAIFSEQDRERSLTRGSLLTADQRNDALAKLTQKGTENFQDGFIDGTVAVQYKTREGVVVVSQTREGDQVSYTISNVKTDSPLTETHYIYNYSASAEFKGGKRSVNTVLSDNEAKSITKESFSSYNLWAEKRGDKLINQALKVVALGKDH